MNKYIKKRNENLSKKRRETPRFSQGECQVFLVVICSCALFLTFIVFSIIHSNAFASQLDDSNNMIVNKINNDLIKSKETFNGIKDKQIPVAEAMNKTISNVMENTPIPVVENSNDNVGRSDESNGDDTSGDDTSENNSSVYQPSYLYPNLTMFEKITSFYDDKSINSRFNCPQSMAVTNNEYVVFNTQWGTGSVPRVGVIGVQVFSKETNSLIKTFYLPDTYDSSSFSYVQNASAGHHNHCNGAVAYNDYIYVADGSLVAKVNIWNETVVPIILPKGVSASGIARWENGFVVKHGTSLIFLNNDFTEVVRKVETGISNNQDISYYNGKAYLLKWTESEDNNTIYEIDGITGENTQTWSWSFTDDWGQQHELEGMDFSGGTPMVLFNSYNEQDHITKFNW